MRTLTLTLEYDGTGLVGWQRQANGTSIQQLLEEALARIEGAPVGVIGAGRTDAGVHAIGQVASVRLEHPIALDALHRALNSILPAAVRVTRVETAAATFHARHDAVSKSYRYVIWTGAFTSPFAARYTWHVPDDLDLAEMQAAATLIEGRHDFAAFQAAGSAVTSTVRTVTRSAFVEGCASLSGLPLVSRPSDSWRESRSAAPGWQGATSENIGNMRARSNAASRDAPPGNHATSHWDGTLAASTALVYEITGNGFLRHMVRSLVGTLVEVGHGRRARESVAQALTSGDRRQAGPTAPAHGLWLLRVDY